MATSNVNRSTRRAGFVALSCWGAVASAICLASCDSVSDQGLATLPGQPVLVASVRTMTVASLDGGFGPMLPAGAPCDPGKWSDTVDLQAGTLTFSRCDRQGTGSAASDYAPATGTRTLTAAQLTSVRVALGQVQVSGKDICGADKPTLELRVASSQASVTYGDDFYSCDKQYPHYVISEQLDNLDAVVVPLGQ